MCINEVEKTGIICKSSKLRIFKIPLEAGLGSGWQLAEFLDYMDLEIQIISNLKKKKTFVPIEST